MKIALVQQSAGPDRARNLERALDAMGHAAAAGARLVAFPELAIDRFFPQRRNNPAAADLAEPIPGPASDRIAARAAELRLVTVFNQYELGPDGRCYDSSPVFDADGSLLGVTRMMHITEYACFHEQHYYAKGDTDALVYDTAAGRVGVAICYDRHYPEYMRRLGELGAQLVVIPQAGSVGEWPEGLFEAELRVAAFQNGYFAALCNRVGEEPRLTFAGESFVVDPEGVVLARGPEGQETILYADVDLAQCETSTARRLFWRDRRPEVYARWAEPLLPASAPAPVP
ncbi:carbon-nitrogen hydrolase family protein [Candidatus Palauibacter sp.]|uniref:carbon-nitrogen hydrolase family protein n=1 Tax=Candidatus Palauibacter sp. TaxID=3101350 RepID=UPI003AF25102